MEPGGEYSSAQILQVLHETGAVNATVVLRGDNRARMSLIVSSQELRHGAITVRGVARRLNRSQTE